MATADGMEAFREPGLMAFTFRQSIAWSIGRSILASERPPLEARFRVSGRTTKLLSRPDWDPEGDKKIPATSITDKAAISVHRSYKNRAGTMTRYDCLDMLPFDTR